jgi:hypothetical protein
LEFFEKIIMAKKKWTSSTRLTGKKVPVGEYTGPELKPKSRPSPHKDVPVLKDKPPVRRKASKKGPIRYGPSRTITLSEQHSVEQQRKRASVGGIKDDPSNTAGERKPKIGKVRKLFGRVGLRAMILGGGGGGGAGRK